LHRWNRWDRIHLSIRLSLSNLSDRFGLLILSYLSTLSDLIDRLIL